MIYPWKQVLFSIVEAVNVIARGFFPMGFLPVVRGPAWFWPGIGREEEASIPTSWASSAGWKTQERRWKNQWNTPWKKSWVFFWFFDTTWGMNQENTWTSAGWWFGAWILWLSIYFRNVIIHIIPTDFHSIIFQRGRLTNHQPDHQWIGLRENLNRKPSIFPLNMVFRLKNPLNQSIEIREDLCHSRCISEDHLVLAGCTDLPGHWDHWVSAVHWIDVAGTTYQWNIDYIYPLVICYITMERSTIYSEFLD